VRLRAYHPDDAEAVAAGYDDPECFRFLPPLPSPFTLAHAERFLSEAVPALFAQGGGAYAIADPDTDRLLGGDQPGTPGAHTRQQADLVTGWARGRADAGWRPPRCGHCAGYAFGAGIARLELLTHWENEASQRVALAAGFQREGVRRGAVAGPDGAREDLLSFARLDVDPPGPTPRLLPDLPAGALTDGVVTLRPLTADDIDFYAELHAVPDVIGHGVTAGGADTGRRSSAGAPALQADWLAGVPVGRLSSSPTTATAPPAGEIGRVLSGATERAGDDRLQHAAWPWRGRGFPTRAAQLLSLWVVRRDVHRPADRRRIAVEHRLRSSGCWRRRLQAGGRTCVSRLPGTDGRRNDDVQYALRRRTFLTRGPRLDRVTAV
jgi:RimJ/RimL family protein N-acetyltransferase